eukprot:4666957-Prymnesium_polylepis.2
MSVLPSELQREGEPSARRSSLERAMTLPTQEMAQTETKSRAEMQRSTDASGAHPHPKSATSAVKPTEKTTRASRQNSMSARTARACLGSMDRSIIAVHTGMRTATGKKGCADAMLKKK